MKSRLYFKISALLISFSLIIVAIAIAPVQMASAQGETIAFDDTFSDSSDVSTSNNVVIGGGDVTLAFYNFDDDFNDGSLDSKWSWYNEPGNNGGSWDEGNTSTGRLYITSDMNTDFNGFHDNGNFLYQEISGDFDIELKTWGIPGLHMQQSGIVVRQDADNWLKLGYGGRWFIITGRGVAVFSEVGGTCTSLKEVINNASPKYLRLRRTGDQWQSWFHNDGTSTWTAVHTWTQALSDTLWVGFAAGDGNSDTNYPSDFDDFMVTSNIHVDSGDITSVPITPSSPILWSTFSANHTIPSGTSLSYKVLDASDDSVLCNISAAQAATGYDISSCAGTTSSIKLKAEFTNSGGTVTPTLHNWSVTHTDQPEPTPTPTPSPTPTPPPVPGPDLIIQGLSANWLVTDSTYEITFTVRNQGDQGAGASTACTFIDGVYKAGFDASISSLGPSTSTSTITIGPFTVSGRDNIQVSADYGEVVIESNELNNWRSTSIESGVSAANCFIATASSGDPDNDGRVQTLRSFRDELLLNNSVGSELVSTYYNISPPVAGFVDDHPTLKPVVRTGLLPAVGVSTVALSTSLAVKLAILGSISAISTLALVFFRRRISTNKV